MQGTLYLAASDTFFSLLFIFARIGRRSPGGKKRPALENKHAICMRGVYVEMVRDDEKQ